MSDRKLMTRQEFYEKYGNVEVRFSSYYKYTFTYAADLPDGKHLTCGCGGDQEAIYCLTVFADGAGTVSGLRPFEGGVYENGIEIEGFYDY